MFQESQTAGCLGILYNGSGAALLGGPSPARQYRGLAAGKGGYPAGLRWQIKDVPNFLNSGDGFFTGTKS